MAQVKAEFLFDFASPNAYFAHCVVPGIAARTGVAIDYVPVLLGGIFKATNNQAPMVAFANVKGKLDYQMLEITRFQKRHAITRFRFNPHFPVNSLAIMRGAVAARASGVLAPYVDAMMRAMWEDGKKMDDPALIREVLAGAGLDADALMQAAQSPEIKKALADNTDAAVARGVFGIPTFFVNNEMWFGKDTLRDVEEAIVAAKG